MSEATELSVRFDFQNNTEDLTRAICFMVDEGSVLTEKFHGGW